MRPPIENMTMWALATEEVQGVSWARWPWHRCRGTRYTPLEDVRCDLRKRHADEHIANRGMLCIAWFNAEVDG